MINNTTVEQTYACNGVVKDFAIPFQFLEGEESVIKVYLINADETSSLLVLNTDYTLDSPATTVTTVVTYDATKKIKLKRVSPLEQESEYIQGPFPVESVEEQFDRLVMISQELDNEQDKFFRKSEGSSLANLEFPAASANKLIGWNAGATALENKDPLDVAQLQADVTQLQADVLSLDGRLDIVEPDLSQAKADIIALDGRLDTAEADITSLEGRITTAEADIVNLQGDVAAWVDLSSDVTTLQGDVVSLDGRLDTAESDINTLESDLAQLTTRVSNLEAASEVAFFSGSCPLVNNEATPTNIPNFDRSGVGTQLANVTIQIDRRTDSEKRYTEVELLMRYITEDEIWYVARKTTTAVIGEPDGVDFTIDTHPVTKVGQVKYTTDNMAGANYSGTLKFVGKEIPTGV